MEHGKIVRSPSLVAGTDYVMKTWGKTPVYEKVSFIHFDRGDVKYKQPKVQLKDMLSTDFYVFQDMNGAHFRGKMLNNCLVRETTDARITFSEVVGSTTALSSATVETPAEPVAETVEQPEASNVAVDEPVEQVAQGSDEGAETEVEIETETEVQTDAAPAVESALDRKRRLDRERKQAQRDAKKAALTAHVTAPTESAVQVAA